MNMLQLYLAMNSCVLEGDDIYYIDPSNNNIKEYVGKLEDYNIKEGTLELKIQYAKPVEFIRVDVNLSELPEDE